MQRQKLRSNPNKKFGQRNGRSSCAHSIGKFFVCYMVLFSFETSATGSPGNYLYIYIYEYIYQTNWPRNCTLAPKHPPLVPIWGFAAPHLQLLAPHLCQMFHFSSIPGISPTYLSWTKRDSLAVVVSFDLPDSSQAMFRKLAPYSIYVYVERERVYVCYRDIHVHAGKANLFALHASFEQEIPSLVSDTKIWRSYSNQCVPWSAQSLHWG